MERKTAGSILIIEDSPEDYETCVRALRKNGFTGEIGHCEDGEQALDFLYRRNKYAAEQTKRPDLILLDLNMPGTDGRDILKEIKSADALKSIPVVILTTSNNEKDIDDCYKAGANTYIEKPVDLQKFMRAFESLKNYWFETAILPTRH